MTTLVAALTLHQTRVIVTFLGKVNWMRPESPATGSKIVMSFVQVVSPAETSEVPTVAQVGAASEFPVRQN
jgi:hypothetical protein